MNPNPDVLWMLFHSRKFLLAMTDAVVSTVMLLATRYLSPADLDFVKQIVVIYQPVIIILIGSIAYEDKARLENPTVTQVTGIGTAPNITTTKVVSDTSLAASNVAVTH